jgi:carboxymethylenebutenolidase
MEIVTQTVSIPARTTSHIGGYLARPSIESVYPAVVVIHEVFGLNDNIRQITARFAREGYVALGVDLFAGRNRAICMVRFFGGFFLNPLNHGAIHDLKAALTYLCNLPQVDVNRLGAVGYCMGGGFAICWACTDERLRVIAPYYGMNPRPLEAVSRACPVVGSYPENDFTAAHGRKLDAALERYAIPHDIKLYPGTGHAFANNHLSSYNGAAAEDSWQRTLAFFKERLSG